MDLWDTRAMQWKGKANRAGKDQGRSRNAPYSAAYTTDYAQSHFPREITFVNFSDVDVAWSVLLAGCVCLMQNSPF